MFTYIYVESKVGGMFTNSNHREIIDKYSKEGWRFVAAIPKSNGGYGQITSHDLVFEKCENS
ncbi:DUF4177 domain-containing protein [Clostridium saudiense]|jgi:hypothetical protein|uniref:DUF4177 domain-containing protein n=1 Tax=Clostridium saudiense TaxID=1414720 RepID=A0ABS2FIV4_9CLOT|nr:DUF4177 domain-containing protein [Clostridium saudiense]MBM6820429.1 DUF4177 domain-containing protein [Clostridium saudiense]